MAGTSYTRQSTLTDGDTITASLFNAEYNQLVSAFSYSASGTTGHQHDGGAGQGGNIEIIGDADFKNKIVVDTGNNRWSVFVEVGGGAVEQVRIEDGVVYPVTDSDIDLGTDVLRFKNAYIDSLTATGNLTVGGNIDGRDVATDGTKLDGIEASADVTDTANVTAAGALMDSELTAIASVKALNQGVATGDSPTFAAVTSTGEITANGGIALGDNDKATFGDGDDLQIYHDGTASYIDDVGTGNLIIKGTHLNLRDATNTLYMEALQGGAVTLRHAGDISVATTATGIDVTGTATMDGLTVESATGAEVTLKNTDADGAAGEYVGKLHFEGSDSSGGASGVRAGIYAQYGSSFGYTSLDLLTSVSGGALKKGMNISGDGDISFYEDTGTTAKLFWDASAEALGIGTSSPTYPMTIHDTGDGIKFEISDLVDANYRIQVSGNDIITGPSTGSDYIFQTSNTERMRIDSSGNVGIGTSSPSEKLHVVDTSNPASDGTVIIEGRRDGGANVLALRARDASAPTLGLPSNQGPVMRFQGFNGTDFSDMAFIYAASGADFTDGDAPSSLIFGTTSDNTETPAERMRIDSSGNVLVGGTSAYAQSATTISSGGVLYVSRSGGGPATFRRNSDDGSIITLEKDGTTVGSIGTHSADRVFYTGASYGIAFDTSDVAWLPCTSTGGGTDGVVDLGKASSQFKDLHLAGNAFVAGNVQVTAGNGILLGGAATANRLDDYEEGTWTPATNQTAGTYLTQTGYFTKIGNVVHVSGRVNVTGSSFSASPHITNLPFTVVNNETRAPATCSATGGITFNNYLTGEPYLNTTVMYLEKHTSGGNRGDVVAGDVAAAYGFTFSATYRVA